MKLSILSLMAAAATFLSSCAAITMPDPTGPEKVGTVLLELRDDTRVDPRFGAPDSKRRILVRVWYPASETANTHPVLAMTPRQAQALKTHMGFPRAMMEDKTPTLSFEGAPIKEGSVWPVLIFTHGGYSYENQSFYLMQDLASHGYIVMAVNHPFESLVSEFPDGTVVEVDEAQYLSSVDSQKRNAKTLARKFDSIAQKIRQARTPEEKKQLLFELSNIEHYADYRDEVETRIGDIHLILDRLSTLNRTELFKGCIDTGRVGIFGHSLGGATAVETASCEPERIAAALNYDAPQFIWDRNKDITLRTPVFFMSSTNARVGRKDINMEGINGAWFDSASAPVYELTIKGAGHYNFSDLTYIPFLKMMGLIGPIDGTRAGTMIKAYTLAFFDRYLKLRPAPILARVPEEWKELDLKSRNTVE